MLFVVVAVGVEETVVVVFLDWVVVAGLIALLVGAVVLALVVLTFPFPMTLASLVLFPWAASFFCGEASRTSSFFIVCFVPPF